MLQDDPSWPTSNAEWEAATKDEDFIRHFVLDESLAFDFDLLDERGGLVNMYEEFEWKFHPAFEVRRLIPVMREGLNEWEEWYAKEQDYEACKEDGGDPHYFPRLEQTLEEVPGAVNPIICVEFTNPQPCFNGRDYTLNIGDGWHRTAIAILKGIPTLRAVVGKHKNL